MKKEIKLAVIVALIEAILAFVVGYALYAIQAESIEKKTIATLSGYFDEIDENMSYDQVMKFLYEDSQKKDNIIETLTQENQELNSLKEQISSDEANKQTIDLAQTYADSSDYVKALAILNSVTNKTPQMEILSSDYKKLYEVQIVAEVDALVYEERHDDAIKLIDDALKVVHGSSTLVQKKEAVQNSKPQIFMNVLSPYEKKGYSAKVSGEFMEMGGSKYFNGFQLGTEYTTSYAVFNLNAQYSKLSGIIGHIDGSGDRDKMVTVFLDGVLTETIDIIYQDLPQEFSIDVTGARQLKIERTDGTTQTGFAELIIR